MKMTINQSKNVLEAIVVLDWDLWVRSILSLPSNDESRLTQFVLVHILDGHRNECTLEQIVQFLAKHLHGFTVCSQLVEIGAELVDELLFGFIVVEFEFEHGGRDVGICENELGHQVLVLLHINIPVGFGAKRIGFGQATSGSHWFGFGQHA